MANIRKDSRYSQANLKVTSRGVIYIDWFADIRFDVKEFEDNISHTVKPLDTVHSLARQYLGKQIYFWVICRSNTIFNPFKKLVPGTVLIVPSLLSLTQRILVEE